MDTVPRETIAKKAADTITPLTSRENAFRKNLSSNIAVITTLVTVSAYVVLYAFKVGYYSIFNIPATCIRVDLRDYLPVLVQISAISIYLVWYTIYISVDVAYKRASFQWMRICYGCLIIYMLFSMNGILNRIPGTHVIIIVFSGAIGIELLVYLLLKLRFKGFSNVKKKDEEKAIENAVSDLLLYNSIVRSGVLFLIIAVTIAPFIGRLFANNLSTFQVFSNNDKEYAVIIDYGEKVLAQESRAENRTIIIDISHYLYLSKDDISFENATYDGVNLISDDASDSQLAATGPESEESVSSLETENDNTTHLECTIPQEEIGEIGTNILIESKG